MPPMRSNIIKVFGFGGGGSNAVNHMFKQQINNVDFIICNTDAQSLAVSEVPVKIQLGPHLTQGLGAGANPEVGKQATEESLEEIRRMLEVNTKMAFITAGMGGGTGTGGAPTIAKVCKEMGILTVGIVTTPFSFEGPKRMKHAQAGIEEMKRYVDTLLVINNDKLRYQYGNLKMKEAFSKADDVLATAARCITDIINSTGQINVDFADVCTVMKDGGVAILGNALAKGENRAINAIEQAINSPLLNDNDIRGAKWILLNIISGEGEHEYTMDEVDAIQEYVRKLTGENTDVILGMGYDSNLTDELGVTIIATGFEHKNPFNTAPTPKKEVKEEKVIVGVLGEEKVQQAEMPTLPENANPLAPVLLEDVPAPNIVEPIVEKEETAPVFLMLSDAKVEDKTVEKEEKSTTVNAELQFTFHETPKVEELAMEEKVINVNTFIEKPSQVYVSTPMSIEVKSEPIVEASKEQEEDFEMEMVIKETYEEENKVAVNQVIEQQQTELSEEELQKKRAQERVEKIKKLRNLSFNFNAADPNNEFEQVPAYIRRDMDLHNSIANVENFYSRAQVKTDENDQTSISTINTFLDGKNPD